LVRLVLRLSPLAKGATLVALVGGVLWIWGGLERIGWMTVVGTVVFFGGAIVYYIERFRMIKRRRDETRG
jgi:hypothetical protein